jgi:hypothetical protein
MDGEKLEGRRIVVEMAGERKKSNSRYTTKGPQLEDNCYNCSRAGHWFFKKVQ